MIALDSSALVALALDEAEAKDFRTVMADQRCRVGWPTLFETYFALHHRVDPNFADAFVRSLTERPSIMATPFDQALFDLAHLAFDRYGKGHHPAKLNFGDCMAYAVAKFHDIPLLFKGDDFRLTDIRAALP